MEIVRLVGFFVILFAGVSSGDPDCVVYETLNLLGYQNARSSLGQRPAHPAWDLVQSATARVRQYATGGDVIDRVSLLSSVGDLGQRGYGVLSSFAERLPLPSLASLIEPRLSPTSHIIGGTTPTTSPTPSTSPTPTISQTPTSSHIPGELSTTPVNQYLKTFDSLRGRNPQRASLTGGNNNIILNELVNRATEATFGYVDANLVEEPLRGILRNANIPRHPTLAPLYVLSIYLNQLSNQNPPETRATRNSRFLQEKKEPQHFVKGSYKSSEHSSGESSETQESEAYEKGFGKDSNKLDMAHLEKLKKESIKFDLATLEEVKKLPVDPNVPMKLDFLEEGLKQLEPYAKFMDISKWDLSQKNDDANYVDEMKKLDEFIALEAKLDEDKDRLFLFKSDILNAHINMINNILNLDFPLTTPQTLEEDLNKRLTKMLADAQYIPKSASLESVSEENDFLKRVKKNSSGIPFLGEKKGTKYMQEFAKRFDAQENGLPESFGAIPSAQPPAPVPDFNTVLKNYYDSLQSGAAGAEGMWQGLVGTNPTNAEEVAPSHDELLYGQENAPSQYSPEMAKSVVDAAALVFRNREKDLNNFLKTTCNTEITASTTTPSQALNSLIRNITL